MLASLLAPANGHRPTVACPQPAAPQTRLSQLLGGTSGGVLTGYVPLLQVCRADLPGFGCAKFAKNGDGTPNRLNCIAKSKFGNIMSWATAPVRTKVYTLRSGNTDDPAKDPTSYHPGEYLTVTLRTHEYDMKFRGPWLLHADVQRPTHGSQLSATSIAAVLPRSAPCGSHSALERFELERFETAGRGRVVILGQDCSCMPLLRRPTRPLVDGNYQMIHGGWRCSDTRRRLAGRR